MQNNGVMLDTAVVKRQGSQDHGNSHRSEVSGLVKGDLSAPGGRKPRVTKSSARASYSLFTMCNVARMRPLHQHMTHSQESCSHMSHGICQTLPSIIRRHKQQQEQEITFGCWIECHPSCQSLCMPVGSPATSVNFQDVGLRMHTTRTQISYANVTAAGQQMPSFPKNEPSGLRGLWS